MTADTTYEIPKPGSWRRRIAGALRAAGVLFLLCHVFWPDLSDLMRQRLLTMFVAVSYLAFTIDPIKLMPWERGRPV